MNTAMRRGAPAGTSSRPPVRLPGCHSRNCRDFRESSAAFARQERPDLGLDNSPLAVTQSANLDVEEPTEKWPEVGGFDLDVSDKLFSDSETVEDFDDSQPSIPYLEGLSACETIDDIAQLNRERVVDRSPVELGATLQAIRRVKPFFDKKERIPTHVKQLNKDMVREMKRTVKKMPPRTIANCIFNICALKIADKALMAKTTDAVASKIYHDQTAFKVVELAQVAAAFRQMAFKSPKLNAAISKNVMALPQSELNVTSLVNLMHDLARMHWRDKEVFGFLAQMLLDDMGNVTPRLLHLLVASFAINKKYYPMRKELVAAAKEDILRQRPHNLAPLTALNMLENFMNAEELDAETAEFLIGIVRPTARAKHHGALRYALPRVCRQLSEAGYDTSWFTPPPPPPKPREQVAKQDITIADQGAPV